MENDNEYYKTAFVRKEEFYLYNITNVTKNEIKVNLFSKELPEGISIIHANDNFAFDGVKDKLIPTEDMGRFISYVKLISTNIDAIYKPFEFKDKGIDRRYTPCLHPLQTSRYYTTVNLNESLSDSTEIYFSIPENCSMIVLLCKKPLYAKI